MKSNKYRNLLLLMNQELAIAYESVLNDLAFTLAVSQALAGKDALSAEEKITEETADEVRREKDVLFPLFDRLSGRDGTLSRSLENSRIFPAPLIEGLAALYDFREETRTVRDSFLSPYPDEEGDLAEAALIYLQRLLYSYRIRSWMKDIAEGIEQYGNAAYTVPEDEKADGEDYLEGTDKLSYEETKKELGIYLSKQEDDDEHEKSDKADQLALLVVIDTRLMGGKENAER